MFGSYIWEILVIVGPIVLAIAIAWAMMHNRQSRSEYKRTEAATRDLYQDPLDHDTTRGSR